MYELTFYTTDLTVLSLLRKLQSSENNLLFQINQNCDRLGLTNHVEGRVQDGTKIVFDEKFPENSFDKILLDAPCSALGQRPQFFQSMKLKELKSFANLQVGHC